VYERIDTYHGPTPLPDLALRYRQIWSTDVDAKVESGQWSSHDKSELVRKTYQEAVGDQFKGSWPYSFLNVLFPMGVLHPHADGKLPPGRERLHLVLQTSPYAWCYHDGTWQQLEEGGIYRLDPSIEHYAVNLGDRPRIHLIVDLE
jgi:aspartyl/asparaginyl beta-hydroxylase